MTLPGVIFTIPFMLFSSQGAAPVGEQADELELADPGEPTPATYGCVGEPIPETTGGDTDTDGDGMDEPLPDVFCLARCKDFGPDEYRATHKKPVIPLEKGDPWCLNRAEDYCHNLGRNLEEWCWGERD